MSTISPKESARLHGELNRHTCRMSCVARMADDFGLHGTADSIRAIAQTLAWLHHRIDADASGACEITPACVLLGPQECTRTHLFSWPFRELCALACGQSCAERTDMSAAHQFAIEFVRMFCAGTPWIRKDKGGSIFLEWNEDDEDGSYLSVAFLPARVGKWSGYIVSSGFVGGDFIWPSLRGLCEDMQHYIDKVK